MRYVRLTPTKTQKYERSTKREMLMHSQKLTKINKININKRIYLKIIYI
jgi:hypothetical protein